VPLTFGEDDGENRWKLGREFSKLNKWAGIRHFRTLARNLTQGTNRASESRLENHRNTGFNHEMSFTHICLEDFIYLILLNNIKRKKYI